MCAALVGLKNILKEGGSLSDENVEKISDIIDVLINHKTKATYPLVLEILFSFVTTFTVS